MMFILLLVNDIHIKSIDILFNILITDSFCTYKFDKFFEFYTTIRCLIKYIVAFEKIKKR